jgi:hypothetical protein
MERKKLKTNYKLVDIMPNNFCEGEKYMDVTHE